jgi:hypothetical protein
VVADLDFIEIWGSEVRTAIGADASNILVADILVKP